MRHFTARLTGLFMIIMALSACGQAETKPTTSRPRPTPLPTSTPLPPLPTVPAPGSAENPLVFIFVNASSESTEAQAERLGETLSGETDLVIQVKTTSSYAEARQALCNGSAAVVSANAIAYLSAAGQSCGEGVYTAEIDGETSTQGQMMAGVGRDIFDIRRFAGYRFCRPSADSMNGWFLPTLALKANSVNPLGDLDSVIDSGSDEGVVRDIVQFKCDVGATRVGAEVGVPNSNSAFVVDFLPPVPNDTVLISLQLDGRVRALLGDTLRDHLDDIAEIIGADGLAPADDKVFDQLRALFKSADVDPASMGH